MFWQLSSGATTPRSDYRHVHSRIEACDRTPYRCRTLEMDRFASRREMFSIQTLIPVYLLRADVIVFSAVIGLWFSRWWWVAIAAVVFAILEYAILHGFVVMIFGPNAPGAKPSTRPEVYVIDIGATAGAFVIWAAMFFLLKTIGKRVLSRARDVP